MIENIFLNCETEISNSADSSMLEIAAAFNNLSVKLNPLVFPL